MNEDKGRDILFAFIWIIGILLWTSVGVFALSRCSSIPKDLEEEKEYRPVCSRLQCDLVVEPECKTYCEGVIK